MGERSSDIDVLVSEVGPRDGLQSVDRTLPLELKCRWIDQLAAAGLREIEVGSFVSPKRLPQLADTGDVVRHATSIDGLGVLALVPNLRGAQNALKAGVRSLSMPISASREHSRSNIGMTPEEAVEQVRQVSHLLEDHPEPTTLEIGLSTAFGCTIEGRVSEAWVIRLATMCAEAGADTVGLSDTTGSANPVQVRRLFTQLRSELGDKAGAAHFHNTRGQGLANVVAALEAGIRVFDASQGGLGGCPYAPGASGNIVTEDLVFLLESMGLRTGIDIDKLVAARAVIAKGLPGEPLYGFVPNAGVPKGFTYATGQGAA